MRDFDEIIAALTESIELGSKLSKLEWDMCGDDLKEKYAKTRGTACNDLEEWVVNWCSNETIKDIINSIRANKGNPNDLFLKMADAETVRKNFEDLMLEGSTSKNSYSSLIYCPGDIKTKIIIDRIYHGTYYEFELLTEKEKLHYIMVNGLNNLSQSTRDWFSTWKLAKGRDLKIDSIFEEIIKL